MANDNQKKVVLFGREISEGREEQNQQGGGGDHQGCSLTVMEMPAAKEKEKINFHEGSCSYSAMENQRNKRKRPENDHDRKSDVSSDSGEESPSALNTTNDGQYTIQKLMPTKKLVHNPTVVVVAPRAVNFVIESSSSDRTQPPPPPQQQLLEEKQQEEQQQAKIRLATLRIGSFRHYRPMEEEEERRRGVTTKLQLYSDQWKVSKRLTMSDVSTMSRVLIHANLVDTHVKPFMVRAGVFNQVESSEGLRVYVWDVETNTFHKLVFKRWASLRSFIFIGNWCREFVRRRSLKEGDEIGFLWDPYKSRFLFRVLDRAPVSNPDL